MKHIFVDTSAWDALADKKDKDHHFEQMGFILLPPDL
jgi:predicted nucleic acid-binding protein